jgi:hypothetical protein
LGDWARLCEVNFLEYIDLVFVFCKDRWLSIAPNCKVFMKHWSLWLMYKAFEISYFMDVIFPSISLFIVLEQLGIGGSGRVVAVIGWCRLDYCNSHFVSNRFL